MCDKAGQIKNVFESLSGQMDYDDMIRCVDVLCEKYEDIGVITIGKSVFGRMIPMLCIGKGNKITMYVGGICGTDTHISAMLLRFVNEYCEIKKNNRLAYNLNLDCFEQSRCLYIVPMLNPDGANYVIQGIENCNPLYDRLLKLNGGSDNFSSWKLNGRGVDLRRNFLTEQMGTVPIECFAGAEPEVSALEGIIKFNPGIKLLLDFRSGSNLISYAPSSKLGATLLKKIGRICNFAIGAENKQNFAGSLLNFCNDECCIPSYTVFSCGNRSGKHNSFFKDYISIRELLFVAPTLI